MMPILTYKNICNLDEIVLHYIQTESKQVLITFETHFFLLKITAFTLLQYCTFDLKIN